MKKRLLSLALVLALILSVVPMSALAAAATVKVTFDPNGGSGEMPEVTLSAGSSYTLPACTFTKAGREFYHWSVGGVEKDPDSEITVTSDTTVKTIWKYTRPKKVSNTIDRSTTEVIGKLIMTDKSTGETAETLLFDEVTSSTFTQPSNPTVNAMINEAKEAVLGELAKYDNAENKVMTVSGPDIIKTVSNITNLYVVDEAGYDDNGDYYTQKQIAEGEYTHRWQYAVTVTADYTSAAEPKYANVCIAASKGGSVEIADPFPTTVPGNSGMNMTLGYATGTTFTAVPEDGWRFVGWYEGVVGESHFVEGRTDVLYSTDAVYAFDGRQESLLLYALFEKGLILGDVDGDGDVTILDATHIQRHLAGIPTSAYYEKAADTDGEPGVSITDATAIQRHLAGLDANTAIGKPIA